MIHINARESFGIFVQIEGLSNMRLKLVMITGIDGSGKTTISKLLVKHLRLRRYRVNYVWIKSLHSMAYLIYRLFRNITNEKFILNPNRIIVPRFDPTDYKGFSKLWLSLEFFSVLPWILLKVYLPIFLGFVVVADRYVIDTIVTLSVRVRELYFVNSFIGRLLLRMIPKETIIIHLDVDLDIVLRRRYDIEYTLREIENQILLYRKLAKRVGAYNINTAKLSIEETLGLVLGKLSL